MKFSLDYRSPKKEEADEVRCPYNQLGTIYKFIQEYPEKRYCIAINGILDDEKYNKALEQINTVLLITPNYTIDCDNIWQGYKFLESHYNVYMHFPITDWETFSNLRDARVTDIYIDGPLCFQCDAIKAGKKNVNIRVSPTISFNNVFNFESRHPENFFIRPEDLHLYEDTIDIIDFSVGSVETEKTLFDIYKRGYFNFDIGQLILGLPIGIKNVAFKEHFAEQRLNCGQKCLNPSHASCHFCSRYFNLINKMQGILTQE